MKVPVVVYVLSTVLGAPSLSNKELAQSRGSIVSVAEPSSLKRGEPIHGCALLAKEVIILLIPRSKFCSRTGSVSRKSVKVSDSILSFPLSM
jgi:hypothetical protein